MNIEKKNSYYVENDSQYAYRETIELTITYMLVYSN